MRAIGLTEEEALRGTGLDLATLRRSRRIGWDAYCAMMDNLYAVVGPEGMCEMGSEYAFKKSFRSIHRIAGLVATPRALYHFLVRWAGPANNTNLRFALKDEADGTLFHTVAIEEGYRDCHPFLIGVPGLLEVIPCMLGLPKAKVELVEVRERFGAYRIHLPESQAIGARLRRRIRGLVAVPSVLIEQTQELKDRSDALNRHQADFRRLVDDMHDGVVIVIGERIVYGNKAIRRTLDLPLHASPSEIDDAMNRALPAARWDDWQRLLRGQHVGEQNLEFPLGEILTEPQILSFGKPQPIRYGEQEGWFLAGRNVTLERRLEERMREVAFNERHRLAMELHDGLGQQLAGISWQSSILRDELAKTDHAHLSQTAENLSVTARSSVEIARSLSHGLAFSDASCGNVKRALSQWQDQTQTLFGLRPSLELPAASLTAQPSHLGEIMRIVSEAAHNAVRHGNAQQLALRLAEGKEQWILSLTNDGSPVGREAIGTSPGLGLQSMAYRARVLGGECRLEDVSHGTRLTVIMGRAIISIGGTSTLPTPLRNAPTHLKARETTDTNLRVFLADDHDLVRVGLIQLLENHPTTAFTVVGQAKERREILPQITQLSPDLLLLDMLMDGQDNLSLIREIRHVCPSCTIVVLSMGDARIYEEDARAAGAHTYLMKSINPEALIHQLLQITSSTKDQEPIT